MAARPPASEQPDLLTWSPPQAEIAFDETEIRSFSLSARYARAVSVALRDCGRPRREVAKAMSAFCGEAVSPTMLDAYASVARETHKVSLPRFAALVHATRDRRLVQMLADLLGCAVVEKRHLPLIAAAQMREREDELRRERKALVRKARREGAI